MIEWIVTSSALIGIVIGLRFLTKGRIPMRLRYGLWVLVLVRLLIPVSIPSSISIMNLLPEPVVAETPVSQAVQQSQQQRPTYTAPTPLCSAAPTCDKAAGSIQYAGKSVLSHAHLLGAGTIGHLDRRYGGNRLRAAI